MEAVGFAGRTQAQRDFLVAERARAIESGEYAEKLGLHELMGWAPPMGANFKIGESERDLRTRAARSGLHLPGQTPDALREIIRLQQLERAGVVVNNFIKSRYSISQGVDGAGRWDIPTIITQDYSMLNVAGASTMNGVLLGLIPVNTAPSLGSPDDTGGFLAAATTTRQVNTGAKHFATLVAAWIFSRTNAAGVYTPAAGTTWAIAGISASLTLQTAFTIGAAFNLNALAQVWTSIPMASINAERQPAPFGTTIAGMCNLFTGDSLIGQLITTGVLNIQGNTLAAVVEVI